MVKQKATEVLLCGLLKCPSWDTTAGWQWSYHCLHSSLGCDKTPRVTIVLFTLNLSSIFSNTGKEFFCLPRSLRKTPVSFLEWSAIHFPFRSEFYVPWQLTIFTTNLLIQGKIIFRNRLTNSNNQGLGLCRNFKVITNNSRRWFTLSFVLANMHIIWLDTNSLFF